MVDAPAALLERVGARMLLPTNIFYAKLALDHLIIHRPREAVNPGYLRQLERENDQTFLLSQTSAARWAPPKTVSRG
jgi:hypothetical protein